MKDLRIVFMGTPEFAATTLKRLVEENYAIVGVITAPDRPAGRGRKLQQSDVKRYALEQGLTVLQPTNLKSEDFLDQLKALRANLQIVVAFRMLPKVVWAMPEYGTFNLHASLLPDYRGAAPINWAIINGETETGVTTFFIDEKIDTGEIILQQKTSISPEDNAGSLHDKLMVLGADLVVKTVREIEAGTIQTQKQVSDRPLKEAFKIHKDTCKIDWSQPIETIHNHIRGLSPYPGAWSHLINGTKEVFVKIYASSIERTEHNLATGSVISTKKELKVAVEDGFIDLRELQLPGKRKMKTADVLNGLEIEKNARMS
ncbi:methionyl-tRNA formyltransferase [Pseudozobellia thermophila]|uniref:Methionyl-tRNA formyltransferase n=1 Tax=Pseudozobellia thermophila TaxID=192903 RepID=A0A1M6LI26_9FLAO|nr:methionyl-tRNA formyltransferase [Pseudozobellia thermophila]SHJ70821.1 methionyl-tRNA formyltransferase [Pseudozobellia thermophila]